MVHLISFARALAVEMWCSAIVGDDVSRFFLRLLTAKKLLESCVFDLTFASLKLGIALSVAATRPMVLRVLCGEGRAHLSPHPV